MTVERPKPKQLLRPITTGAASAMNQSQFLAITCNSLEAREKSRVHGAIGFGFASHWLKNWRESFEPITKRSNRDHVITFRQAFEKCSIIPTVKIIWTRCFEPFIRANFPLSLRLLPQWQRKAPLRFPHILPQQAWCSIPDFRPKDLHCPQLPYPPFRNQYALWWTSSSRLKENTVLVLLFSFPQTPIEKVTYPVCNGENRNHCLSNEGKSLPWLQLVVATLDKPIWFQRLSWKSKRTVGVFVQETTIPRISRIVGLRQALILHLLSIGFNQMFDLDVREKP